MSLTLPTNYGNHAKTSNLVENWIIQLGYNEAFDQALDPDDDSINLVDDANFDAGDTSVVVDEGSAFTAGDYIKVDNEVIKVTNVSSETLTIVRGQKGTTDADHSNNSEIYFDNYIGIALSETTVSEIFYHGVVTNEPRIRTSVDVFKSKANSSQISISLINFDYQGSPFSEEILYGTRNYLNRTVKIYSQLNNDATLTNCLQIFHGRLVDVSHDNDRITLSVVEKRPWDFIEIPNQLTVVQSNSNELAQPTYFPVVYGAYSGNVSTGSTPAFCYPVIQDAYLHPIPVHRYDNENFICLAAEADTSNSSNTVHSVTPHFYEPNIDSFIPTLNSSGNTYMNNTVSYQGGYAIKAPLDLFRSFRIRPNDVNDSNEFTTYPHRMHNTSSGSGSTTVDSATEGAHGQFAFTPTASSASTHTDTKDAVFNIPRIDGRITSFKVTVKGKSTFLSTADYGTFTAVTQISNLGGSYITMQTHSVAGGSSGISEVSLGYDNSTAGLGQYDSSELIGNLDSSDGDPSTFTVRHGLTAQYGNLNDGKSPNNINGAISDIQFKIQSKLSFGTEDVTGAIEKLNKVKILYTGADGLNKSYNGGSGTATKGHEVHRDMLFRYAGYDAHDDDIYNWDEGVNIESIRSSWTMHYWLLEPKPLKDILEQLQYEMGFWFKWRHDGSGSYWCVKNSYSSGDVVQTFTKDDISKLSIRNTSFKDLVTHYDVEYKRHPARNNRYLLSLSSSDTTSNFRTTYNIKSKENKKSVKLDMNTGAVGATDGGSGNPNDGFTNYYLNLSGSVRKIVSFQIVNPAVGYNLETGDIIQFSPTAGDMPVKPFGHNWNESGSQYFMIVELQRSRGAINIKSLEVG